MSPKPAQTRSDQSEHVAESDSISKQPPNQVRFAPVAQEIDPPKSAAPVSFNKPDYDREPEDKDKLLSLAKSLHDSKELQGSRLRKFSFDPVSLPASRVRTLLMSQNSKIVLCLIAECRPPLPLLVTSFPWETTADCPPRRLPRESRVVLMNRLDRLVPLLRPCP